MDLYDLFLRCITIPYQQTGVSANYAFEIVDNVLYIYFEDSSGVNDWLRNLNFPARPYVISKKLMFGHGGFLKVFNEIKPKLTEIIISKDIKEIVVVGYSHGAGVAVFCYEYIWETRKDLRNHLKGYGFGAPRVIFGLPIKKLQKKWNNFTVVRNIDDIVTHLPPFIFGFYHVGKLLKIGQKGKYTKIDAHKEINILRELRKQQF